MNASQFKGKGYNYLNLPASQLYKLRLIYMIWLSAHMFLFCFYALPYILNVTLFSKNFVNIFSIAVHVFHNFFRKICPLSEQILITCLKCSRASFLFSSYSKKAHCGQSWLLIRKNQLHALNLLTPWGNKKLHILKQVYFFQQQVCMIFFSTECESRTPTCLKSSLFASMKAL